MSQICCLQKVSVMSALSSVMFLGVVGLSTAAATGKEETSPSWDNSQAGGSIVSLVFNESEMGN